MVDLLLSSWLSAFLPPALQLIWQFLAKQTVAVGRSGLYLASPFCWQSRAEWTLGESANEEHFDGWLGKQIDLRCSARSIIFSELSES